MWFVLDLVEGPAQVMKPTPPSQVGDNDDDGVIGVSDIVEHDDDLPPIDSPVLFQPSQHPTADYSPAFSLVCVVVLCLWLCFPVCVVLCLWLCFVLLCLMYQLN